MNKNYVAVVNAVVLCVYSVACIAPDNYIAGSSDGTGMDTTNSSSTGESECMPITCIEAGAECGQIPDGCGNYISCASCRYADGWGECGSERYENGRSVGATPNVCGGGCLFKEKHEAPISCETVFPNTDYDHYFWCTPSGLHAVSIFGECLWAGSRSDASGDGGDWCCQKAPKHD